MPLAEATRLAYLSLLGIEQWLPRALDTAVPAPVPEAVERPGLADVSQTVAPRRDAGDAVAAPPPPAVAARLDELLAGTPAKVPAARTPAAPGDADTPASAGVAAVAHAPESFGCALLLLPGGLLLVADFARPDAVGLASAESAMFLRLAAALAPGQELAMPTEFAWPPAGVRLPGMARPGAAAEALGEMLASQRRRGLRRLAVLGERSARLLAPVAERLGLPPPVVTVSLAAMLLEPELKRDCWAQLAPLRSDAAT